MRLLRDILRFWPGRVLGPMIVAAAAVFAGISLQSQRVWQAAPPHLQELVLTATPVPITSPIRIHSAPAITLLKGKLVGPRSIAELVESWVSGENSSPPLVVDTPEIVIGGPSEDAAAVAEILSTARTSIVDVSNGVVRWPLIAGGELSFENVDARIELSPSGAMRVSRATAQLAGRRIAFTIDIGPASSGTFQHSLNFALTAKGLHIELKGILRANGTVLEAGSFRIAAEDAGEIATWLGLSLDGNASGPVLADGVLSVDAGLVSLEEASIEIGGNRGKGSVRLQVTEHRPFFDSTLAFAQLDLGGVDGWLLSEFTEPAAAMARKSAGSAARVFEAIDVDLRLSADTIRIGALATGHGAISVTWRDKGLTVQLAGLDIYGGDASGQLDLKPRPGDPRAEVALKLENVDLKALLTALGLEAPLDASGHVSVALTAAGRSWREAREGLSGQVAIRAPERATIRGGLERVVRAAMGPVSARSSGGRAVDGLDWQIAIENGVMARQSLAFDVNGMRYGTGVETSEDDALKAVSVDVRFIGPP